MARLRAACAKAAQGAGVAADACADADGHGDTDAPLSPAALLLLDEAALRACGFSARKAGWLRAAAQAAANGELDADALRALPDDEVQRRLTALPGVGVWTAEMLMLFCLLRPDILSWGDFGIRRGICLVHGLAPDALTRDAFEAYRALYTPHGSLASLYLWHVAGQG